MRRLCALLLVLWASPAAAYQETVAFGEEPLLSVIVEPEHVFTGGAYVQGEIVVTIRISSLYPFEALEVDVSPVKGARTEVLLKPRMRQVRSYAGTGFVLERVIALYPQKSGKLTLPPVTARGKVSPAGAEAIEFEEQSPAITLDVAGISPRFDGDWWLVSPDVRMEETWSKPVEDLREGDVVRREVTLTARGVPHTRLTLPEHGRTQGIPISEAGSSGRTETSVDGVVGTLTRAWDLKIGVGQTLYVAPMGVKYWNPVEGRQRKAAVRGYRIEPLPADENALAAALMTEARARHSGLRLIAVQAAVVAALPILTLFLGLLWALLPTRADLRLRRMAGSGAADAVLYRAALRWASANGLPPSVISPRTPGGRDLSDQLFRPGATAIDDTKVIRKLLALSRQDRLRRFWSGIGRIARRLFGVRKRLASI